MIVALVLLFPCCYYRFFADSGLAKITPGTNDTVLFSVFVPGVCMIRLIRRCYAHHISPCCSKVMISSRK